MSPNATILDPRPRSGDPRLPQTAGSGDDPLVTPVGWSAVLARRLERSSLDDRAAAAGLEAVVGRLGGVQAQLQASAELQLAARVTGLVRADVRSALWERRSLVKAWTVRGTLHLHRATELPLWFAAKRAVTPPAAEDGLAAWRDPAGLEHPALSRDEVSAVRAAVRDALDGRCLSRAELADAVVERVGPAPRERLHSGFSFLLEDMCQGPPRGNVVTFARPDQWIEGWHDVDESHALREVCRRYVHAFGPVRPADFATWFASNGLKAADARSLFESLGLVEVDVEGRSGYVLPGDETFGEPSRTIRLVPEYDAYVMGFRERERLVPDDVRRQIAAHRRGRYEGPAGVRFVLVDGIAAGLWERSRRGSRIELHVTPARPLDRALRRQLDGEAERIGAFLGLTPDLSVES
jgi:hypothetical protein